MQDKNKYIRNYIKVELLKIKDKQINVNVVRRNKDKLGLKEQKFLIENLFFSGNRFLEDNGIF